MEGSLGGSPKGGKLLVMTLMFLLGLAHVDGWWFFGSEEESSSEALFDDLLCCVRRPPDTNPKMAAKLVVNFHTLELEFREKSLYARISNNSSRVVQGAELASGLLPESKPEVCHGEDFECVTFSWSKLGRLVIKHVDHGAGKMEYQFEWEHRKSGGTLRDSFQMEGAHWYGAAQVKYQHWPIEKWSRHETAYVTGDSFVDQYGGVMERYWLSSNGVAIFVDADVPLFVGMNDKDDGKLSLCSKWSSPYRNVKDVKAKLTYRVFIGNNVKEVHDLATNLSIAKPEGIPDNKIFRHPIWSTWARYKKDINQQVVMEFARDIKRHGFKAAQVEIDDDWTTRYGDHDFNPVKFPNPKKMVDDLTELGFRVTIWIHPFCSPMSQASAGDYWIKSGFLPGHTTWWNGVGKILDVTKPEAVAWFKESMKQLQVKYGITSFKFDAGETNWLPNFASPKVPWSSPNDYSTRWAKMCYECDTETKAQEVRVGFATQNLPIFVRMMDKDSNWGFDNGLKSLIPHALTFGIIGYPFVLPDMIGGNAYSSLGIGSSSGLPEKELFIRWMQANTFLPSMQFSLCPWQYDDEEVMNITKEMTQLHEQYSNYFIAVAEESVKTGAPIIRPLWWTAPNNERALTTDDQFMVGNDIIVAPVLIKGATSRTVYLPPGQWNDMLRKTVLQGGKVYSNYPAALKELPYFTREGVDFNLYQAEAAAVAEAKAAGDVAAGVATTAVADAVATDVAAKAVAEGADAATAVAAGAAVGEAAAADVTAAAETAARAADSQPPAPTPTIQAVSTPEPVQPEPAQPEPVKPEPAKPEPAKPELAQPEPAKVESAQAEPAKPEPPKSEHPPLTPPVPAPRGRAVEPSSGQLYVESLVEQQKNTTAAQATKTDDGAATAVTVKK